MVDSVGSAWKGGDKTLIAADGRTTILPVVMAGDVIAAEKNIDKVHEIVHAADGRGGFDTLATGTASISSDFSQTAERDLQKGEGIGVPIALIILLLVFGTLVAASLPLFLSVIAITLAIALTAVLGQGFDVSVFALNVITMMGLATGIDYSLFIVSRYREERLAGRGKVDALTVTGGTASRAVFFSGMTVVLALLGMLIVPTNIFASLAIGAILVVTMAVVAALTLLPAVLSLLGDKIDRLRVPYLGRRLLRRARRRPRLADRAARAAGDAPAGDRPGDRGRRAPARGRAVPRHEDRGLGRRHPARRLRVQAGLRGARRAVLRRRREPGADRRRRTRRGAGDQGRRRAASGDAGRGRGLRPDGGRDQPGGRPHPRLGPRRRRGVRQALHRQGPRAARRPHPCRPSPAATRSVYVTGETAGNVDYMDIVDSYFPYVVGLVLALSFILLLVAFRSVVIPATAIVMNLLSVGAAYGLMTLVSQDGWGAGLLGFQQVDAIEQWVPLFLFSILFGLSMDYQVFLLSRIKEDYDRTGDNRAAVASGIGSTAGIITGAALIMVAVFAGFASGNLVMFQQMGFGLAVAVLLDATIVRTLVVPSTMSLLGRWNWYLPRWLEWLPRLSIEGAAAPGGPPEGGPEGPGRGGRPGRAAPDAPSAAPAPARAVVTPGFTPGVQTAFAGGEAEGTLRPAFTEAAAGAEPAQDENAA